VVGKFLLQGLKCRSIDYDLLVVCLCSYCSILRHFQVTSRWKISWPSHSRSL